MRAANGLTWVALLNFRPQAADRLGTELDAAMWQAVGRVQTWPRHDLSGQFGGCGTE